MDFLSDNDLERFARHITLKEVGGEGQKKLLKAKVLVVGAGGLGSPILFYLAAAGIGTIGIIDDDTVAISNLQRQIIHNQSDVGIAKVKSAERALKALNPNIRIHCHEERLSKENVDKVVNGYDIIADGCDNFRTRFTVNRASIKYQIPLVSGALQQFEGQLASFRPWEADAQGQPFPCYECFVTQDSVADRVEGCAEFGILGSVAGIIGTLQATEVIKQILNIGETLTSRLLIYDALSGRQRIIHLRSDPCCKACGQN